ncbi:MAG: hypothetical protein AAGC54_12500 [Cyanobacteria bacterium P01_F01_bin.4]
MSSSRPYESKVLRFFLSQFQQGLERHRRAMRQAQNTAAWGLQVALSPIQRAAKMAGRQMGAAGVQNLPLLGWFRQRNEPTGTELTRSQEPSHAQTLNPSKGKKFSVSVLIKASVNFLAPLFSRVSSAKRGDREEPQSIAPLTDPPRSPSNRGMFTPATATAVLEPPIAELLEAIQHWLLPEQLTTLSHLRSNLPLQLPTTTATGLQTEGAVTQISNSLGLKSAIALQGITSDLTTRSLLLIGLDNTRLDLLSQPQQALLKHQISVLMDAYWQYCTRVPSLRERIAARLPARWQQASLGEQPAPAVKWQTHVQQILTDPLLKQPNLSASSTEPPSVATTPPQTATDTLAVSVSTPTRTHGLPNATQSIALGRPAAAAPTTTQTTPSNDVLSTYATVIGYIEHPLEKLLRWIDQGLTWLENLWSKLRSWYQLTFR